MADSRNDRLPKVAFPTDMKQIEITILNNLKNNIPTNRDLLQKLTQYNSGDVDSELLERLNNPANDRLLDLLSGYEYEFEFWLIVENYLVAYKHHPEKAADQLALIEGEFQFKTRDNRPLLSYQLGQRYPTDLTKYPPASNTHLLPRITAKIARKIYLTGNQPLIDLFLNFFPKPRAHVFKGTVLPDSIAVDEKESTSIIKRFLEQKENTIEKVEKLTMSVQRRFRAKQRNIAEQHLIAYKYKGFESYFGDLTSLISAAHRPYIPKKCDKTLAARILMSSQAMRPIPEVRHVTNSSGIENIFNDALFGQRNLLQLYLSFKPSQLGDSDIKNGDGNVICLGAGEIDAYGDTELIFDCQKISENNPCVFYKQRDLGFSKYPDFCNSVQIGEHELRLNFQCKNNLCSLQFEYNFENKYGLVLNHMLISRNTLKMPQILALNFFKFIDDLRDGNPYSLNQSNSEDKEATAAIYHALSKMDNDKLIKTLQNISDAMSKLMEFNIYGAYKIDFSALLKIKFHDFTTHVRYTLDLRDFTKSLGQGDIMTLTKAMTEFPFLFRSYRFIDYLLSFTMCPEMSSILNEARNSLLSSQSIHTFRRG